jgi:lysozyme family protein
MAAGNDQKAISVIFGNEGGFQADPRDPGNYRDGTLIGTKYGIAARSHPGVDIRNLTLVRAAEIYRAEYWCPAGCEAMPSGVDLCLFDDSVMSGVSHAQKLYARNVRPSPSETIDAVSDARRAFLRGLRRFSAFGKGWLKRVSKIQATAHVWALNASGANKAVVVGSLLRKAEDADRTAKRAKKGSAASGGVVTGAGASTGAVPANVLHDPQFWLLIAALAALALIVGIVLYHKHRARKALAQAYIEQAKAVAALQPAAPSPIPSGAL